MLSDEKQKEAERIWMQLRHRLPGQAPIEALRLLGVNHDLWWYAQGRYEIERDELKKLRISVARIAQALGLDNEIPGERDSSEPANFQQLNQAAEDNERGWNRLCACILTALERLAELPARL